MSEIASLSGAGAGTGEFRCCPNLPAQVQQPLRRWLLPSGGPSVIQASPSQAQTGVPVGGSPPPSPPLFPSLLPSPHLPSFLSRSLSPKPAPGRLALREWPSDHIGVTLAVRVHLAPCHPHPVPHSPRTPNPGLTRTHSRTIPAAGPSSETETSFRSSNSNSPDVPRAGGLFRVTLQGETEGQPSRPGAACAGLWPPGVTETWPLPAGGAGG